MVLWVGQPRELKAPEDGGVFKRYTEKQLDDLEQYQIPGPRGGRGPMGPVRPRGLPEAAPGAAGPREALRGGEAARRRRALGARRQRPAARRRRARARRATRRPVTQLVVSATQWNRVARLLDRKIEVEVEIDVKAAFHEDDTNGYNVVAELPGTDKKGEVVMLGAHLDSWHPGTGATDNAAGSAVMMEAIRILKAIDAKPKRTDPDRPVGRRGAGAARLARLRRRALRLAAGAEGGGPGRAAVLHAERAAGADHPEARPREALRLLQPRQRHRARSAAIYLQENAAAKPVFEAWMESVKDLGATRITMRNTGGTDHQSFDAVGLPGFQFIQDPIEYMDGTFFGTHHTDMDIYDRLQREDLMQAAVVIATFAYNAATRDEMLPRKPLPPVAAPPAAPAPAGKAGTKGGAKPAPKAVEAAPGAGAR